MRALSKLIKLITDKRIKKVELFDEHSRNKQSNYYKLFEGIHTQSYKSDEDAAQDIYDCEPNEKKYLILKTRLRQKLLNTLFFVEADPDRFSHAENIKLTAMKTLFQSRLLFYSGIRKFSLSLIEKEYRTCINYQHYGLAASFGELLLDYYTIKVKYKDFSGILDRQRKLTEMHFFVSDIKNRWLECELLYNRSKSNNELVSEKCQEAIDLIEQSGNLDDGVYIKQYYFNLLVLQSMVEKRYHHAFEYIAKHQSFAQKHPDYYINEEESNMTVLSILMTLHLKNKSLCEDIFSSQSQIFLLEGKYKIMADLYRTILDIHLKEYQEAANKLIQLESLLKGSDQEFKELLHLVIGYIYFISKNENSADLRDLLGNLKSRFNLKNFLSQTVPYDKTNRDININKITLQILFLSIEQDWAKIDQKIEEIEPYTRSFPKKDMHYRSELFISMLIKARESDLKYYKTNAQTESMFEELKHEVPEYRMPYQSIELMPYEHIWKHILDILKTHRYG